MDRYGHRSAVSDDDKERAHDVTKTLRIGVIGFGWMGQAHSRGVRRAPSYFLEREYEPELVVVSDTVEARRDDAVKSFGYQRAVTDWHEVVDAPDVDVVFVTAPNMLHVEMVEAAAAYDAEILGNVKEVPDAPAPGGVLEANGYNVKYQSANEPKTRANRMDVPPV